jgi:maltose O-acetyltransferase
MTAATPIPSQSDGNSERPKLHAAAPPVAEHNEPAPSTGAVQPPAFLAERAKRALREEFLNSDPRLWIVLGLCRLLPPLGGNRLRTSLLRLGGLKIGAGTVFGGVLHVHGGELRARRLQVGASCWINADCTFDSSADIVIEDDVAIGQQVLILTNTHEIGESGYRAGPSKDLPVRIRNGVWIGARATILPGVTVGAGTIVAAGSVVTKSTPDNVLVAGVPARIVKNLPT